MRMLRNCRVVMMSEEVRAPKEAMVLRRMMSPIAEVAERRITSHIKAGLVRRRCKLGRRDPETLERRAVAMAMRPAKQLVQICVVPVGLASPSIQRR